MEAAVCSAPAAAWAGGVDEAMLPHTLSLVTESGGFHLCALPWLGATSLAWGDCRVQMVTGLAVYLYCSFCIRLSSVTWGCGSCPAAYSLMGFDVKPQWTADYTHGLSVFPHTPVHLALSPDRRLAQVHFLSSWVIS